MQFDAYLPSFQNIVEQSAIASKASVSRARAARRVRGSRHRRLVNQSGRPMLTSNVNGGSYHEMLHVMLETCTSLSLMQFDAYLPSFQNIVEPYGALVKSLHKGRLTE
jgi:hypothetical protein